MPDCPCGGENPNCFRCWGKGWYELDNKQSKPNKKVRVVVFKGDSTEERKLVTCPICTCQIKEELYDVHLAIHKRRVDECKNKELIQCSVCSAKVRADRMQKHLRNVHSVDGCENTKSFLTIEKLRKKINTTSKERFNRISSVSRNSNHRSKVDNSDDNCQHDAIFGDKDLGYFARDNGRFGSLPLYDDYSEDSDAD